jgi:hypothetical protein
MLQRTITCVFRSRLVLTFTIEAWHIVNTTDPLMDSDDENPDEHVCLDYCG